MGNHESRFVPLERNPSTYIDATVIDSISSEQCHQFLQLLKKKESDIQVDEGFSFQTLLSNDLPGLYEIVMFNEKFSPKCFSLLRSDSLVEAEIRFSSFSDLLTPFADEFGSIYKEDVLSMVVKTKQQNPEWDAWRIASYVSLPEFGDVNVAHKHAKICGVEHKDVQEVLLCKDASMADDFFQTKLFSFISEKYPEFAENFNSLFGSLQKTGKELKTKYTESPIHIAIMLSHDGLVNTLLENGVNGNTPCGHAYPIHLAMQHESTQCAKKLIEHLPECLQLRDKKYGGMPIHWVKSSECVDLLVDNKVELDEGNIDNETALHIMVKRKRLCPLVSLITHGANVDAVSNDGNTPLHYAVQQDDVDIVRALLFLGADYSLKNNDKKTPLELLKENSESPTRDEMHEVFSLFLPLQEDGEACSCKKPVRPISTVERKQSIFRSKTGKDALISMDGGGIKGLVLTEMLLELEELTGHPVYNLFDWVAGTSTGSYLALSLSKGKPLRHCQKAYLRLGRSCMVGIRPYPTEKVDRFLLEEFGEEAKMAEIQFPKVMVPTVLADRRPAMLHLFRNYNAPYDEHYQLKDARFPRPMMPADQLQWLTIRSSCSAPSYFRATGRYLDGGLIANNPTLDAMSEVHKFKKYKKSEGWEQSALGLVLSLGTGRQPLQLMNSIDIYRPSSVWDTKDVVNNVKAFMELMVDQTTNSDDHVVDRAQSWCEMIDASFFRFSPTLSSEVELNETNDRILLNMLCDVRKYIRRNSSQLQTLANQLLGKN